MRHKTKRRVDKKTLLALKRKRHAQAKRNQRQAYAVRALGGG